MSLQVDAVFMAAIEADPAIMSIIGGRRWCTAAPMPEDDFIKDVAVPYVIVNFDGLTSSQGTKDDVYDSGIDVANVSITVAAQNPAQLADLAARIRRAVHTYLCEHCGGKGIPTGTTFGAAQKFYDEWKPAYCITMNWQCDVDFDLIGEYES
jgi:hypothetical protein